MVFFATAIVVFALSLFACQTKYDFTGFGPYFIVGTLVLLSFGFMLSIAGWLGLARGAFQGCKWCMLWAVLFCSLAISCMTLNSSWRTSMPSIVSRWMIIVLQPSVFTSTSSSSSYTCLNCLGGRTMTFEAMLGF